MWTIWWGFCTSTANLQDNMEHWRYIFASFSLLGFIVLVIGFWFKKFTEDDGALISINSYSKKQKEGDKNSQVGQGRY